MSPTYLPHHTPSRSRAAPLRTCGPHAPHGTPAAGPAQLRTRLPPVNHARSTRDQVTRAARTQSPARPRTRAGSHTPAFPVPACFSGNSALHSPPPRPEALAVFLASLVSAPSPPPPPPRPARPGPAPLHPAGDPGHPLPHRHSRGDSRLSPRPRIFPLATWGAGRSPALNFLLSWDS